MKSSKLSVLILSIAFIVVAAVVIGLIGNSANSNATLFIEKTSDEDLKTIISNVDYLLLGEKQSFENVQEISPHGILNLYASTKAVQDKMDTLSSNFNDVEIPLSDIHGFVTQYFGDYAFDVEKLISNENLGESIKFNKEHESLLLSKINGGVIWPGAMPFDLTIDSVKANGENIMIEATRHAYDNSAFSQYDKINLIIKATKDGFNYVSYNARILK